MTINRPAGMQEGGVSRICVGWVGSWFGWCEWVKCGAKTTFAQQTVSHDGDGTDGGAGSSSVSRTTWHVIDDPHKSYAYALGTNGRHTIPAISSSSSSSSSVTGNFGPSDIIYIWGRMICTRNNLPTIINVMPKRMWGRGGKRAKKNGREHLGGRL